VAIPSYSSEIQMGNEFFGLVTDPEFTNCKTYFRDNSHAKLRDSHQKYREICFAIKISAWRKIKKSSNLKTLNSDKTKTVRLMVAPVYRVF